MAKFTPKTHFPMARLIWNWNFMIWDAWQDFNFIYKGVVWCQEQVKNIVTSGGFTHHLN